MDDLKSGPDRLVTTSGQSLTRQPEPPRMGSTCPRCGGGKLDYNGLLELECPVCGYVASGGGACT